MNRLEFLRRERERVVRRLASDSDRAKCQIMLMIIDDEIAEMTESVPAPGPGPGNHDQPDGWRSGKKGA